MAIYKYRKFKLYLLDFLKLPRYVRGFVKAHPLYVHLHALLIALVMLVILIQAGSLFLYDYIPDNLSLINKAYSDQLIWKNELYKLETNPNKKANVSHQLNISLNELQSTRYSWAKKQSDTRLAMAYKRLAKAHADFAEMSAHKPSHLTMIQAGQRVVDAYDNFIVAAQDDIVIKQSLVSLLQFACLLLVFCIGAGILLASWNILINRLGKVIAIFPEEIVTTSGGGPNDDEYDVLQRLVTDLSARFKGLRIETEWINKASTVRTRKILLSQSFLLQLVKLVGGTGLSEQSIIKTLYSLERTLNIGNVALVFSDSGSRITAKRALFSSFWPVTFEEEMFDEPLDHASIRQNVKIIEGKSMQSLTVPLTGPLGWLGILIIETEGNHFFEDSDLQMMEVTAQLFSLSIGFQAREQESRRVALLEERAVIARELHDSLAQSLSFLKFQLSRLQTSLGKDITGVKAVDITSEMREGLDNAYKELRELLTTFRVQMDIRGLDHVLEQAIEEFSQRSSLSITLDNRLNECKLGVNEEFHLLHIIREALSNIVRHSGAQKVNIALILRSSGDVLVTIDDDGKGCGLDEKKLHHYGISIMTERAYCLGGTIEMLPRRKGGTSVRLLFHPK